jgi:hypothetical protein
MTTHPLGSSERPSFLVSQRFWIYGLLFLLTLGILWWDRENRRALAQQSPATSGGEASPSASAPPTR